MVLSSSFPQAQLEEMTALKTSCPWIGGSGWCFSRGVGFRQGASGVAVYSL